MFPSTVLIICCSPDEAQAQETLSTLKFGECAKRVTTFASANVVAAPDKVSQQLSELRAEVVRLKRQVRVRKAACVCVSVFDLGDGLASPCLGCGVVGSVWT